MTLKELQDKRLALAAEIRTKADAFNANGKKWKDDGERQNWEKVNADYDANLRELEAANAAEQAAKSVDDRLAALNDHDQRSVNHGSTLPGLEDSRTRKPIGDEQPQIDDETRGLALAGFIRGSRRNQRQAEAMQRLGMHRDAGELVISGFDTQVVRRFQRTFRSVHPSRGMEACEARDLSSITMAKGGQLVGSTLLATMEINMLAFGGMRQVSETLVTSHGERMVWPTADDTSNTGTQIGENASISTSVDPSFAGVAWDAYKFSSKPILVPFELLEDSFVDLPRVIGQMLGERLGRITNTKYTTGSGANTAAGIVTKSSLGVTAASATAIAADELIGLVHSIDPAYRSQGCGFMCHDSILLHIRKLKDAESRYLLQFGLQQNMPDTILGYSVTNNQDMQSSVATATKTILFGRLGDYKIRRVNQVRFYRLEERYRDTDQDGFIAFVREDGNLLNAGTATVKHLLQA